MELQKSFAQCFTSLMTVRCSRLLTAIKIRWLTATKIRFTFMGTSSNWSHHWSLCNQMDFNIKKCKIMRITRKQVPFTNSEEADRMLSLVKRTCKDLRDTTTLKTLYCFLIRSNLEYCSVVWSPFIKRNIDKLERTQRRATNFILKSRWTIRCSFKQA